MFRIGINFDVTYIVAGIVDENHNIIIKDKVPTLKYRSMDVIIKDMAQLCMKLVKKAGLDMEKDIEYVGVGCYGSINYKKGIMLYSSFFDERNVPIKDLLSQHIDVPIYCDNDANCYALAENKIGATKGLKNAVVVTMGTAISGGIIIENKVYHGLAYGAGEFGHHVIILDGEKCHCGRNGCWAAYASMQSLVRDARIMAIKHPESLLFKMVNGDVRLMSFDIPFEAAEKGDPFAEQLIHSYARYVAVGLINIVNILQPQTVALGGKIRKVGQKFIDKVNEIVVEKTFGQYADEKKTKVILCELDYDAVIIGATLLK